MFCNKCGSKLINDNDLLCPYCGTELNAAVSTANQTKVINAEPVQQQEQQPVYQNQQTSVETPKKQRKKGTMIGILVAFVILALGICIWQFDWYKIITGEETVKVSELKLNADFEFTEADDLYFVPQTNNFMIITLFDDDCNTLLLLSYDENDKCVQIRYREDYGYELSTEDIEDCKELYSEDMTNFDFDGSVMYMDYPSDDVTYHYTKDEFIDWLDVIGSKMLINVSE